MVRPCGFPAAAAAAWMLSATKSHQRKGIIPAVCSAGRGIRSTVALSWTKNGEGPRVAETTGSIIPRHVALICDGNSRWAKARGLSTYEGHFAGVQRVLDVLPILWEDGVEYVTLYLFSVENWNRSKDELEGLWKVIGWTAEQTKNWSREGQFIGHKILGNIDDERIPEHFRKLFSDLEESTNIATEAGKSPERTICWAINYGGQQDLLQATRKLVQDVQSGAIDEESISLEDIEDRMYTRDVPHPDLIVRTSGECRLSNFMLWNAAYSEIFFCDALWPDFDKSEWDKALEWFNGRDRRFGGR